MLMHDAIHPLERQAFIAKVMEGVAPAYTLTQTGDPKMCRRFLRKVWLSHINNRRAEVEA